MLKVDFGKNKQTESKTAVDPNTYPDGCFGVAVILIPGPLHFTSVHGQKVTGLLGKHTHIRPFEPSLANTNDKHVTAHRSTELTESGRSDKYKYL